MKRLHLQLLFILILFAAAATEAVLIGQVAKAVVAKPSIVVAVLSNGTQIEPITFIDKGKILSANESDAKLPEIETYFSPKRTFDLIFGGKRAGSVEVVKRSTGECAGTSAEVSVKANATKLTGFVMGLATDLPTVTSGPGSRRRPTASERTEIEKLVRTEFSNEGVSKTALQKLRYHNLTAMEFDAGKAGFVGSYWVASKPTERTVLFFVAEGAAGALKLSHKELNSYGAEDIMAGAEMSHLDEGALHELLLDVLDYDADGVAEIFTTVQAFEGRNFRVYKRTAGKWEQVHQSYSYHCAF